LAEDDNDSLAQLVPLSTLPHHSSTPALQHSITPALHHSITPALFYFHPISLLPVTML